VTGLSVPDQGQCLRDPSGLDERNETPHSIWQNAGAYSSSSRHASRTSGSSVASNGIPTVMSACRESSSTARRLRGSQVGHMLMTFEGFTLEARIKDSAEVLGEQG
jgi:hypothetical protein